MRLRMIAKIVKEDLLSSLTGGFYFDSAETHLTNLVHLYTWIIFFISPLVAYLLAPDSYICGALYGSFIVLFTTLIKFVVWRLHPSDSYICGALYGSFIVLFTTLIKFVVWRLHRILDTEEPILLKPHDSGTSNQLIRKSRVSTSTGPHEPSLTDHVTAPENIVSMHDVEDRCRRVGQAGLDMAGKSLSAIVPRDFYAMDDVTYSYYLYCNLMEALQNNQSIVPRQLPVSSFSSRPRTGTNFADHPCVPAVSLENSNVSSRALNNSAANENIHPKVPGRSSNCDKLVGTLIHEQALTVDTNLCTNQPEAKSAVCFENVLIDKDSELPSTMLTPVPHSSPATIRKPVHRQLSWVAANSCMFNGLVKALRYHRSIWTSNFHASHRQASTLAYIPPSLFPRPLNQPTDIAEFNLADAVLFWRRHFATAEDSNRAVRTQSLRRPIQHTLSFKCCDRIRKAHLEWRSNSLRHTYFSPNQSTSALRQPLRRPGSALRLGRQQSMESTSSRLSSQLVAVDTTNLRLHSTIHSSMPLPSTSKMPLAAAAAKESSVEEDEANEVHLPSHPGADALICVVDDSGSHDELLSNTTVNRRLIRRPGFRRKTLLSVTYMPKQGTSQSVTGLSSRGLEECNDFDDAGGDTQNNANPKANMHSRNETGDPDSRNADCELRAIESTTYGRIPEASTSAEPTRAPARHTVDVILAQLMGVSSLADAGLTREQCLAQLRDSGNAEESENAELDILFAVTAATCSVDEQSVHHTAIPTERASALSCLSNQIGVADRRTSTSSTHVTVTHGRGLTETARSAIQLDGSEDSVEAVSLPGMNDARSNPASPHPTIFKRLNALTFASRRRRPNGHVYRVRLFPCFARPSFNVRLSRLQLDALFDRGRSILEFALAVFLSLAVSLTGFLLLRSGAFHQMGLVACCFTIAGCHYSLVKSVQPDAASPQHGFNRIIVYSRSVVLLLSLLIYVAANLLSSSPSPTHFLHEDHSEHSTLSVLATVRTGQLSLIDRDSCFPVDGNPLLCSFDVPPMKLLPSSSSSQLLPYLPKDVQSENTRLFNESHYLYLFGSIWTSDRVAFGFRSVLFALLTIFPLLFLFGLIPQINTALIFILEQLDIHLFGGSGSIGLLSASFSILRSLMVIGLGYWFCYNALKVSSLRQPALRSLSGITVNHIYTFWVVFTYSALSFCNYGSRTLMIHLISILTFKLFFFLLIPSKWSS
ncbi:hypothetical protein AHF37_03868 [Paragonimus kellicotti]|nr:hypothetical protein AHF37_03868 [Paragonimus kellicotti]